MTKRKQSIREYRQVLYHTFISKVEDASGLELDSLKEDWYLISAEELYYIMLEMKQRAFKKFMKEYGAKKTTLFN